MCDPANPNVHSYQIVNPSSTRDAIKAFGSIEQEMTAHDGPTDNIIYFSGRSWAKSGFLEADFGFGPYPIEKKLRGWFLGAGATKWVLLDGDR